MLVSSTHRNAFNKAPAQAQKQAQAGPNRAPTTKRRQGPTGPQPNKPKARAPERGPRQPRPKEKGRNGTGTVGANATQRGWLSSPHRPGLRLSSLLASFDVYPELRPRSPAPLRSFDRSRALFLMALLVAATCERKYTRKRNSSSNNFCLSEPTCGAPCVICTNTMRCINIYIYIYRERERERDMYRYISIYI